MKQMKLVRVLCHKSLSSRLVQVGNDNRGAGVEETKGVSLAKAFRSPSYDCCLALKCARIDISTLQSSCPV